MPELLGIIARLKNFMSNSDEEIYVSLGNEKKSVLTLYKDRLYNIPDFQRQIRWSQDDVAILIEDIKTGPKFLGNIILTKHINGSYSIIDGQQRITVLTMILSCIRRMHEDEIETIIPCRLTIESFSKFWTLLEQGFEKKACTKDIVDSDKLKQISDYMKLWEYISGVEDIVDKYKAKELLDNLGRSTFNIVINEADNVSEGIRYFIDVNLKGQRLDVEDIFKSYLFKNDSGDEIRTQWYLLKINAVKIQASNKMTYPLLKLLEHYFLCDLYANFNFKGMEFGQDFLLKKLFKGSHVVHRNGTHLIEVINNNKYMIESLKHLNEIIRIMLEIIDSNAPTTEVEEFFSSRNQQKIDHTELRVIHNIIGKILKDSKMLPKALLMKYFIVLHYGNIEKNKDNIRTIYGIYLFTVLFTIFENKKSSDVLLNIIKADEAEWYTQLINQIGNHFDVARITDARLSSQYKLGTNEDEEDQRFRCKSLATIYNFFSTQNGRIGIKKGKMKDLYRFITDDDIFSVEHFIISEPKSREIIVQGQKYEIDEKIYKRYVNSFFNFIFIKQELNSQLGNKWLPQKLEILEKQEISCEYSKMVIQKASILGDEFSKRNGENYKDQLDLLFVRDFKDLYIEYAKSILNDVIKQINNHSI